MILSVALCTYNGENFLREQLESILSQSLSIDEIIICDDCSKDNTIGIIESYRNKYPELIQLYKNRQTLGTIKNFEKAISLTKGDLLFLADQDDVWHKDKVAIMVQFFKENCKCKLLFTDGDLINEFGDSLNATLWEKWGFNIDLQNRWKNNKNAFKDLVVNNNKITGATVCFNKSLKKHILPIELPYGYWHDGWLGLNASAIEGLMFINKSLIDYRIHKNQQVGISNNVSDVIILNANRNNITKEIYYNKIKKTYPHLKKHIPHQKKRTIKKFLLKIKFYFKSIL